MTSKGGGYPVNGSLERGSKSKAQCFVGKVLHAVGGSDRLTGSMRQLKVSIHSLEVKRQQQMFVQHMKLQSGCYKSC